MIVNLLTITIPKYLHNNVHINSPDQMLHTTPYMDIYVELYSIELNELSLCECNPQPTIVLKMTHFAKFMNRKKHCNSKHSSLVFQILFLFHLPCHVMCCHCPPMVNYGTSLQLGAMQQGNKQAEIHVIFKHVENRSLQKM